MTTRYGIPPSSRNSPIPPPGSRASSSSSRSPLRSCCASPSSASDADEAATLVNAVAQAYLQDSLSRDQKQRLDRLKDLKEVCEQSEEKLRSQRKRLQGVAESLKANDHQTNSLRQQIALEEYVALRKELIAIESELRQVSRSRVDGTRAASPEGQGLSDAVIEQTLDDHPEVLVQAQKVAQAEKAVAQIKATALPGYHGIADAEEEVERRQGGHGPLAGPAPRRPGSEVPTAGRGRGASWPTPNWGSARP